MFFSYQSSSLRKALVIDEIYLKVDIENKKVIIKKNNINKKINTRRKNKEK